MSVLLFKKNLFGAIKKNTKIFYFNCKNLNEKIIKERQLEKIKIKRNEKCKKKSKQPNETNRKKIELKSEIKSVK